MRIINTTLFFALLLAGIVFLQIFLSRKESKWPGLVLPAIFFLIGLLYPLNMMAPSDGELASFLFLLLLVWIIGNIPTMILLAIYFSCREKFRQKQQLDKMNIQDLD